MSEEGPPAPRPPRARGPEKVPHRGRDLLRRSRYNKGPAFTLAERDAFGIRGLLPPRVNTIEEQVQRVIANVKRKPDDLARYTSLAGLQDRNERLFYRVLHDHLDELMPIVYTPTVGLACQRFSDIFRRPRGLWISPAVKGRVAEVLANAADERTCLIVVTDNERILGLGDLGAGGMGIPIGKLALYTVAAGVDPVRSLPVSLDVGTDNEELRRNPMYLGWPQPRLRGKEYDEMVDEFVRAVKTVCPRALVQWEDFKKQNAFAILDRYRDRLLSFNDDIQGTAAVVLAATLSAVKVAGTRVTDQRVVVLGGGAAGVGITRQLSDLLKREGVPADRVRRAVAVLDSGGLIHEGRDPQESTKREVAWTLQDVKAAGLDPSRPLDLKTVVERTKPTILIGASGQPGIFTEEIVRLLAASTERPVILPLSNPTSKTEARPEDLLAWTNGRAIVATGSPFAPVSYGGRTYTVGQANNVYVFPGVGMGALLCRASRVTEAMFTAGAEALADQVTREDVEAGRLFPPIKSMRGVSARVAAAVMRRAAADGFGTLPETVDLVEWVRDQMWPLDYPPYLPG